MPEEQQEPVQIGRVEGGIGWMIGHDGRFTSTAPVAGKR